MAIDVIKESIECEQLLGENFSDNIIKAEYVIPDTHPDVIKILTVEVRPKVNNKEVMKDKVYLEGDLEYNVIYLAKEEETMNVFNVSYTGDFLNYVEVKGADYGMDCECEAYVEHMDCNIINERKIGIEGVVKLKAEVYKKYNFEIIKDVEESEDIQMLKNPMEIDKIVNSIETDIIGKGVIEVPNNYPEVDNILNWNINIQDRVVNVYDDKVSIEGKAIINLIYKGKDTRDVFAMEKIIDFDKDLDVENAAPFMRNYSDFYVEGLEVDIKDNDIGEKRVIDLETLVKVNIKLVYKEDMNIIEDAYSPSIFMEMKKESYELNVTHGEGQEEIIVKDDIEIEDSDLRPKEILSCIGNTSITDKRIVEDKVIIDGVLNVNVLYKTNNKDNYIESVSEEIPFSCTVDIPGSKIQMESVAKCILDSIEANIEGGNIAIRAIVKGYAKVNYISNKEFLVDIECIEGELPKKKASITIYVVQNGDTLWKIAKRYYTTIENIININELENPDTIKPGDKLIIPGRAYI
ncbi:DUF3794 and LysM peptidoglycan-binding domain-containing protein [Clostridium cochlearium]|uniref:DUF3794 and LysM peptidoglycan-binding domain-containing protein n=1 Tax=Clostridium cochlearium TaxID=1494 RepID=UPI001C0EBF7E|nr:SPOCS domain-containing protein [Clostridium cochlearium]MBU5270069.1 DUF3794 domain-containing protein [Clostridium cochlearium]